MDQLAIDALITEYAVAVDDGDWVAYRGLFTPDGRADYSSAGGVEGAAAEVSEWLESTLRAFPMHQHLIVNRRLRLGTLDGNTGDTAQVQADYVNAVRMDAVGTAPDCECGGRCTFDLLRTPTGWRVARIDVREKWRRTTIAGSGRGGGERLSAPPAPRTAADSA